MKSNRAWRVSLVQILLGVAMIVSLVVVQKTNAGNEPVHVTTDWSHRHVVFSKPKTLGEHVRLLSNPRYVQQFVRRNGGDKIDLSNFRWRRAPETPNSSLQRDWSIDIGAGITVGAGMYPAKYSFNIGTARCDSQTNPDFVVYNTSVVADVGGTQPTVVAFDNLYSGCSGATKPLTYWAFNTSPAGSGGTAAVTSPILSPDGTQVAFIQDEESAGAFLVVLRWAAGFGSLASPVDLPLSTPAAYAAPCASPCYTQVSFSPGATTSVHLSSPFYDYSGADTLYVGDDKGNLHKFTGVFNGTPAEVTTAGWPVAVSFIGTPLTAPVYDSVSRKVFVTDGNNFYCCGGADYGGNLYSVDVTTNPPTVVRSVSAYQDKNRTATPLGLAYNTGFVDGPVLDPTTGMVYVFAPAAYTAPIAPDNSTSGCTGAVFQFPVGFTGSTVPGEASTGACNFNANGNSFIGDFDNTYYTGAGITGNMYFCGYTSNLSFMNPTLFQIPMSGTFGSVVHQGPALATGSTNECGPVTEIFNPNAAPAKDWIFTSMQGGHASTAENTCNLTFGSTGCIMSFDVTSGVPITGATTAFASLSVAGGASGVVVDNTVGAGTLAGASQIYFTPLADQTCKNSATSTPFVGNTNSTTTVVVTSGTVNAGDIGAPISGTGIPLGDTITNVVGANVTLATAATATNNGVAFTMLVGGVGGCATQASQTGLN